MITNLPSVKKNAILNSIRIIMTIVFPLITYPYVTRVLRAENLGKVNFASTTLSYFALIAVLGLTNYAGREGQQYRDNSKKLSIFCSELLTLNLLTTIFAYVLLIVTCICVNKLHPYIGLLAIYSTTIVFSTLGMEWLYTLYEDYLYITVRSIVIQFVSLILLLLLVKKEEDYYTYAFLNTFASVGGNIFNFFHARKYITFNLIFNKKIFCHLKSSLIFFSSSIASSIYSNIDTTMLGLMCGDYTVGIYSVAVKIYTMIKTILVAIISVTSPRLTYYRLNGMIDEYNILLTKLIKVMITFMLPIVVGINIVCKEVIFVICGTGFTDAELSLRILSIAILGSIFASITNGVLLACRLEKKVLKSTVIAAITNFITNIFAIPVFSQNGAAFTTALSEFVVLVIGCSYARKLTKIDNMNKVILSSITGCILMLFSAYFMEILIANVFLKLILKIMICVLVYYSCLLILRNEIVIEYSNWLIEKILSFRKKVK